MVLLLLLGGSDEKVQFCTQTLGALITIVTLVLTNALTL